MARYGANYVDATYNPKIDMMANLQGLLGDQSPYPTAPQPSMSISGQLGNSDWMSPTTSSVVGNGRTLPMQGTVVPYAPVLPQAPVNTSFLSEIGQGGVDQSNISNYNGTGATFGSDLSFGDTASSPSWFSGMGDWASKNKELINGGVGLVTAGLGAFNAWNTNQTAKDQLKFQKESFSKQYEAQKGLTNSQLSDRQARRVAEHPTTATSVNDYMKQYGVK